MRPPLIPLFLREFFVIALKKTIMYKKTNTLLWAAIIIAAIAVVVFIARPEEKPAAEESDGSSQTGMLRAEETRYDFGKISMARGKVSHVFTIQNTGTGPVTIERLSTSCMCTSALLQSDGRTWGPFGMAGHGFIPRIDRILEPNGIATIEVIFDPAAHGPAGVGRIERIVSLENSAGETIELSIAAFVTP